MKPEEQYLQLCQTDPTVFNTPPNLITPPEFYMSLCLTLGHHVGRENPVSLVAIQHMLALFAFLDYDLLCDTMARLIAPGSKKPTQHAEGLKSLQKDVLSGEVTHGDLHPRAKGIANELVTVIVENLEVDIIEIFPEIVVSRLRCCFGLHLMYKDLAEADSFRGDIS